MEKHEDQGTKAVYVTTPKSSPRQLRRIWAHCNLSAGSDFSVPSSFSHKEQVSMYLLEGNQARRNLKVRTKQCNDCHI